MYVVRRKELRRVVAVVLLGVLVLSAVLVLVRVRRPTSAAVLPSWPSDVRKATVTLAQATRQKYDTLVICHPNWRGIQQASLLQHAAVIQTESLGSLALLDVLANLPLRRLIINGVLPGTFDFVASLSQLLPHVEVSLIYHGTPVQHGHETEAQEAAMVADAVGLMRQGCLHKLAFVKPGVAEVFLKMGLNTFTLFNFVPRSLAPATMQISDTPAHTHAIPENNRLLDSSDFELTDDVVERLRRRHVALSRTSVDINLKNASWLFDPAAVHIGVMIRNNWRKNLYTQVLAACLVPNAVVHVLDSLELFYLNNCPAKIVRHAFLSHDDYMGILAAMDINLHVTVSEACPMTVLESLAVETPILTSNTHSLFANTFYEKYLVTNSVDNPVDIANDIQKVLDHRDIIMSYVPHYMEQYRKLADKSWIDFIYYKTRRHVMFVTYEIAPITKGGAGYAILKILKRLIKSNYDITILSFIPENYHSQLYDNLDENHRARVHMADCDDLLRQNAIEVSNPHIFSLNSRKFAECIRQLSKTTDYDLIEFFDYAGIGYFYLKNYKPFIPVPVAIRLHGTLQIIDEAAGNTDGDQRMYRMEKEALSMADVYFSPSKEISHMYATRYSLNVHQFLHRPLELDLLPSQPPALPGRQLNILVFSKYDTIKGVDRIIRAFTNLATLVTSSNAHLYLIGADWFNSALNQYGSTYFASLVPRSISSRVHFITSSNLLETSEEYGLVFDVAIVGSYFETFCLACHQVYSRRVPMIVPNIDGLRGFINSTNALVYRTNSELEEMMKKVMKKDVDLEKIRRKMVPLDYSGVEDMYSQITT